MEIGLPALEKRKKMYELEGYCRACQKRGYCCVTDRTRGDKCKEYKRDRNVKIKGGLARKD